MPRLRRRLDDSHMLKKQPYLILNALRDFETQKGLTEVCKAPQLGAVPAGVALLNHLETLLHTALDGIPNPPGAVTRYLKLLTIFNAMVIQAVQTGTPTDRATLTALLKAHTRAFNSLKSIEIKLQINQNEWIKAIQCTVAIWGNHPPIR